MNNTFVDKIFQSIQSDIITWQLLPGQRLHIADLAEKYGIGPGPVREALSRLISTDLVRAVSQRGFRVRTVSSEDLHDVYQTRAEIEAIALRLSIEKGDDEWEALVISNYHRLAKFEQNTLIKTTTQYQE